MRARLNRIHPSNLRNPVHVENQKQINSSRGAPTSVTHIAYNNAYQRYASLSLAALSLSSWPHTANARRACSLSRGSPRSRGASLERLRDIVRRILPSSNPRGVFCASSSGSRVRGVRLRDVPVRRVWLRPPSSRSRRTAIGTGAGAGAPFRGSSDASDPVDEPFDWTNCTWRGDTRGGCG